MMPMPPNQSARMAAIARLLRTRNGPSMPGMPYDDATDSVVEPARGTPMPPNATPAMARARALAAALRRSGR